MSLVEFWPVLLWIPIAEFQELCLRDKFTTKCPEGHVIVMHTAEFGRMRIGKCARTNFGYIPCSNNVMHIVDQECSGRRECFLDVFKTFREMKPCGEVESYLELNFTCLQGGYTYSFDLISAKSNESHLITCPSETQWPSPRYCTIIIPWSVITAIWGRIPSGQCDLQNAFCEKYWSNNISDWQIPQDIYRWHACRSISLTVLHSCLSARNIHAHVWHYHQREGGEYTVNIPANGTVNGLSSNEFSINLDEIQESSAGWESNSSYWILASLNWFHAEEWQQHRSVHDHPQFPTSFIVTFLHDDE